MLSSLRDSLELFNDHVWFFRFFLIIMVICIYRTLLHYVLRFNHCANPFCSKCLNNGSVRGRAISYLKKNSDKDGDNESLSAIIHHNLLQYDRLCQRNNEKPTVYFHRGLSSSTPTLPDQAILLEHYDELRQEMTKFFQANDSISWTNLDLYRNGKEFEIHCQMFPKFFEILQLLPNAICVQNPDCLFSNCFITVLTPEKQPEKENPRGMTNCALRLHFGLICDDQSAPYVLIEKQRRFQIKNKSFAIYNGALEHSIINPGERRQVFLTVDFWHQDLSKGMRDELTSVFHQNLL